MTDNTKDIRMGRYLWHHADLGGGEEAYSVCDPDGVKVAVIFADDTARPIDERNNTKLAMRIFGTKEFSWIYELDLRDALLRGNVHIEKYRHAWTVQSIMDSIPQDGPRFRPFLPQRGDHEY